MSFPTVPGTTLLRFLEENGPELGELRQEIAEACRNLPNDGSKSVQVQGVNLFVLRKNGADVVMVNHTAKLSLVKAGACDD